MAKQYPRIHSLSTVGIQHHYHTDYIFHPYRTDFSGDSGVGKSMIADMLQLVFVGNEFQSSTEGTDERLAKTMPAGRYGYVFINAEVEPNKYVVLGMFISTATINPDPFIIQGGYGKDAYIPLQSPVSYHDLLNGDIVEDIDTVTRRLSGRLNCQRIPQKAYHDYLMEHELLPIQIIDKARLKNYARILRSFARGRDFKYTSDALKNFFFDDQKENELLEDFRKRLDNIEADLDGHKRHKEILQDTTSKEQHLIKLHTLQQQKEEAETEYYKAKCIFHFRNIKNKVEEIARLQERIKQANRNIAASKIAFRTEEIANIDILLAEIQSHTDTLAEIEKNQKEVINVEKLLASQLNIILGECQRLNLIGDSAKLNVIQHIQKLCDEIRTVERWIGKYGTIENVKFRYYGQQENNKNRDQIRRFEQALDAEKLKKIFLASGWIAESNIEDIYLQKMEELDKEIKKQKALSRFADTKNSYSLSSWALRNKKPLTKEQESVLVYYKDLMTQKPEDVEEGARYLPVPEKLFNHLSYDKSGEDGFWLKSNGIHRYIPYVETCFFDTYDTVRLEKYFAENFSKSQNEVKRLEKEKEELRKLKELLNRIGSQTIEVYKEKEEIQGFETDRSLEKTPNDFESVCSHYFYKEEIEIWKSEIDKYTGIIGRSDQIKKQIENELSTIALFMRKNKLQVQPNPIELYPALLALEKAKNLDKRIYQNQIRWYSKISNHSNYSQIRTESQEYAERKVAKQNILKIEIELEEEKYDMYTIKYEARSNEKLDLNLKNYQHKYHNPDEEEKKFDTIRGAYRLLYDDIVDKYVYLTNKSRFKNSEDFLTLSKEILPEVFAHRIINNETGVLKQIKEYLTEITNKYTEFSDVKLNILKEIFAQVEDQSIEYMREIAEIRNYFSHNDCQISQGVSLNINHDHSDVYPITWIRLFLSQLEDGATYTNLFASLREKIGIEEMMKEAYLQCGGKARRIDTKNLLNPKSYFNIEFSMQKSDGTKNPGSTGQTYAAIALLCIARLSLIEKKVSGRKQPKGLRFMPIDEAENVGSNFDMLDKIAQENDYQLIVISRGSLDDYSEKGRYQYMLNGRADGGKIGTFAIFKEGEEATEYPSSQLNV